MKEKDWEYVKEFNIIGLTETWIRWGEEPTNKMITAKIGKGKEKVRVGVICEEDKEGKIIIGGDFNTRTAEKGGRNLITEDKEESRKSKDINEEGKYMEKLEEIGMHINGDTEGGRMDIYRRKWLL
ncbi:hypothetical protein TSAR_004308 [Trichomalopsis sarcophagae]|uniref:Endonuclease/exonuclease/phosphatase domain-containing protein n=1 Tax=Trichomalopsis sarcophagae TaxID=543379 RepID=A0A232F6P5_9HYME|nr:hypothetical protein TSAR_004308 [Trichomalopsis sarcophagae]